MLNVLSLFSGIGGIELGLERAGMTTVGQVELNPFCQHVLAHHWPEVPRHDDVRTANTWWDAEPRPRVHVVAGGFPCQPFSLAGKQLGITDERWMWPAMADVGGPQWLTWCATWDPTTSSWKTSETLFETETPSDGSSVTWPASGSMRNGECFRRPSSAPLRQRVNGSSSWPTARAATGTHGIAWARAEAGDHRSQIEEYLAHLWLREGRPRVPGLKPNPEWIGWLMGFPAGWIPSSVSGTPSSPPRPSTSGD